MLLGVLLWTAWMIGACDGTMNAVTTPGFPTDTVTYEASPADTVRISFNVGLNWKISSDKDWCRIDGEYLNTSGKSGKHTIPFVVSDKGHGFVDEQAAISLRMEEESRVIAYIIRRAKEYALQLSGEDGAYAAGESILLGTSGSMTLNVETNFGLDQLRMENPAWLKVTREGAMITLAIVEDSMKYTINHPTDSLVLMKSDSTFRKGFHVQYAGMDEHDILIKPQIQETLIVSRDAKRCHLGDAPYSSPIAFTVTALNDSYELVAVAYDQNIGCAVMSDKERWFEVEDDHCGNIRLSFAEENQGKERMAYLLALPQAIADSIVGGAASYEAAMSDFLLEEVEEMTLLKEETKGFLMVYMAQDGAMNISISPETRWGLKIATDGKTYGSVIKGDTCYAPVEAVITTYRGYELVGASYDSKTGCSIVPLEESWLNIVDDKQGNVKVYFDANPGDERTMYLFALPLPLVESLGTESSDYHTLLAAELFEDVEGRLEIKQEVEQFLIAEFVQDANEESSMKVLKKGIESIEVTKVTDAEWLSIATEKGVPANKVFGCSLKIAYPHTINPLLPLSVWNTAFPENNDKIEIYGKSGKKYESGVDYQEEHVIMEEMQGNYILVDLYNMRNFIKEDFIIYFIDNGTEYLKALVVTLL